MFKNSATNINNSTYTPEFKHKIGIEAQTLPIQETSPQASESGTESLLGNQTWSIPVQCPNDRKNH